MFKQKVTPASIRAKSENIVSIFTKAVTDLTVVNDEAAEQLEQTQSEIDERYIVINELSSTIDKNDIFIAKINNLIS
jgi:hypothetical protein